VIGIENYEGGDGNMQRTFRAMFVGKKRGNKSPEYPERIKTKVKTKSLAEVYPILDKEYMHIQYLVLEIVPLPKKKKKRRIMLSKPKRRKL